MANIEGEKMMGDTERVNPDVCPTCGSPKPHLHPAVQSEGEVQPCSDPFHGPKFDPVKIMGPEAETRTMRGIAPDPITGQGDARGGPIKHEYERHFKQRSSLIDWYEGVLTETGLYPGGGTGNLIAVNYCCLGLGEIGELQGKLKKIWRGDKGAYDLTTPIREAFPEETEKLLEELGDALWYLTRLSNELGVSLAELMERNAAKVLDRKARGQIRGEGDNR